jgi:ADP-ribose pyrophosphatase YjhB (NUDIX family)
MHAKFYIEHQKFYVAVDCIIFGFDNEQLKLLLIKRNFEPELGTWSLMGGFLNKGENLDDAAQRILKNLTGLSNVYLEQLHVYGDIDRDPGERVISVAYYALIRADNYSDEIGDKHNARWFELEEIPNLVFDHNQMVDRALRRLKRRTKTEAIGFELLPKKFTIPQLQKLYEAIHQENLDKRNFRKKILSFGVLKKLDEKDKEGSKKGAYLYEFKPNRNGLKNPWGLV